MSMLEICVYTILCVVLGSIIGLIIYSLENKIPFKKAISIKWEVTKLLIKNKFNK